jgi:lysozyme
MIPSGSVRGLLIACLFGLVASLGVSREVAAQDRLRGIDVSHHQGDVDWAKVKGSGVAFAFAKATEGETYTDPKFARNWAGMREAGLVRGAYHFGRPGRDPVAQARNFVQTVGAQSGDLQLALDLEKDDGKSPAEVWDWTKRFLAEVKRLTGRPGIIYTSRSFWVDKVGDPRENLDCPLWIAAYRSGEPPVPKAWSAWSFWQHSDKGTVPGVGGNCDLDYFNGDEARLNRLTLP